MVEAGRAGVCERGAQLGEERHLAGEHELGGEGPVSKAVEGSTTSKVFEAYLEHVLAPTPCELGRWW